MMDSLKFPRMLLPVLLFGFHTTGCHQHGSDGDHGHGGHLEAAHEEEFPRGPHGGRWFESDGFAVEMTIFETGVPPQFRAYAYADSKPLPGDAAQISVELHRLGVPVETVALQPVSEYHSSPYVVYEPHSFDVKVRASHGGRSHEWSYSQIEGRVVMDAETRRHNGVVIEAAGPGVIREQFEFPGEVVVDPEHTVRVASSVDGIVTEAALRPGDKVEAGGLLAVIESREAADARAEALAAQAELEAARLAHERETLLRQDGVNSEEEMAAARQRHEQAQAREAAARQALVALGMAGSSPTPTGRYELRSPIAGEIIEKYLVAGEAAKAGDTCFVVADLSQLRAEAQVFATDLSRLKLGGGARVSSLRPELESRGRLTHIGAVLDTARGTATVRASLEEPAQPWRPGMPVTLRLEGESHPAAVRIPLDAIQIWREMPVVFAEFGDTLEVRPLELGNQDREGVEVLSGLSPGARYAAQGSFLLRADMEKAGASHDH